MPRNGQFSQLITIKFTLHQTSDKSLASKISRNGDFDFIQSVKTYSSPDNSCSVQHCRNVFKCNRILKQTTVRPNLSVDRKIIKNLTHSTLESLHFASMKIPKDFVRIRHLVCLKTVPDLNGEALGVQSSFRSKVASNVWNNTMTSKPSWYYNEIKSYISCFSHLVSFISFP